MRAPPRSPADAGFTLIELLTVIAIIGILAAIFIPTIGAVRERAQRAVDSNNLREIAKAAMIYAGDNHDRLPDPQALATALSTDPVYRWPGILAKNHLLTEPSFYFAKNDQLFDGVVPAAIISPTSPTGNQLDPSFTAATKILAWEFVGGVRMGDPATTPLAYTRGLQATGTWDPATGVYKDSGGFVAFLGGNVVFYTTTTDAFTSNQSGQKVTDLRQAIPFSTTNPARLYGTPPSGGTILGSTAGVAATRGP